VGRGVVGGRGHLQFFEDLEEGLFDFPLGSRLPDLPEDLMLLPAVFLLCFKSPLLPLLLPLSSPLK
jgi:hypothetical protein